MKNLIIKFLSDVRAVFKNDEEIKFEFDKEPILLLGKNGSGKSTLLNSIRIKYDNIKEDSGSLSNYDLKLELAPFTKVESDFKNHLFLSSEFDNPLTIDNAYDACAFVNSGGYYLKRKSNGQRIMAMFNNLLNSNKDKLDSNTLVVLDEIDTGLDLYYQSCVFKVVQGMVKKFGCGVLMVTHSALPFITKGNFKYYDIISRDYITDLDSYFKKLLI